MSEEANLRIQLDKIQLSPAAVDWLCDLYAVIQLFDDVADGDGIERRDLDRVIWASLIGMNTNEFWLENMGTLIPIMGAAILKWQASDHAERDGVANAVSFVWRAGFYDLVLIAAQLCHGREVAQSLAPTIMGIYGETYEKYQKEFEPCQSQS